MRVLFIQNRIAKTQSSYIIGFDIVINLEKKRKSKQREDIFRTCTSTPHELAHNMWITLNDETAVHAMYVRIDAKRKFAIGVFHHFMFDRS